MRRKRIPLRVVFLSVAVVFIGMSLILHYAISGELFFGLLRSEAANSPKGGNNQKYDLMESEEHVDSKVKEASRIIDEHSVDNGSPIDTEQMATVPETPSYQVVQLVIPDLSIDQSAGSVSLVPWQEGESLTGAQAAFLANAVGQELPGNQSGATGYSAPDGQVSVDLEAIREMLGLGTDAQFTIYDLSGDFFYETLQMEQSGEASQPIIIRLDDARWIVPQSDGSFQIDTSWQDDLGLRRFIIIAKSSDLEPDSEDLK